MKHTKRTWFDQIANCPYFDILIFCFVSAVSCHISTHNHFHQNTENPLIKWFRWFTIVCNIFWWFSVAGSHTLHKVNQKFSPFNTNEAKWNRRLAIARWLYQTNDNYRQWNMNRLYSFTAITPKLYCSSYAHSLNAAIAKVVKANQRISNPMEIIYKIRFEQNMHEFLRNIYDRNETESIHHTPLFNIIYS